MAYKNTEDQRKAWRRYYHKNKNNEHSRTTLRKETLRKWLWTLKSTLTCLKCPENHPACLDFHHRNKDDKEFTVSQAVAGGWSQARILEEIAKCDVLCSNCHRKFHYAQEKTIQSRRCG